MADGLWLMARVGAESIWLMADGLWVRNEEGPSPAASHPPINARSLHPNTNERRFQREGNWRCSVPLTEPTGQFPFRLDRFRHRAVCVSLDTGPHASWDRGNAPSP